jgi:hypothetical protein
MAPVSQVSYYRGTDQRGNYCASRAVVLNNQQVQYF